MGLFRKRGRDERVLSPQGNLLTDPSQQELEPPLHQAAPYGATRSSVDETGRPSARDTLDALMADALHGDDVYESFKNQLPLSARFAQTLGEN